MVQKIMNKKDVIFKWGGRAALAFIFCLLCAFYYYNMWDILNSDISTQLVLSELLNEEKSILSTNWYYATELRILGYNIFFTPLFSIFSDWNVIRTVGSAIMVLTLELSLFYFCRQLKISRYFILLGILFLIPFSQYYFMLVIVYTNYIPFHVISLFSIGLVFQIPATWYNWKESHSEQFSFGKTVLFCCCSECDTFLKNYTTIYVYTQVQWRKEKLHETEYNWYKR